MAADSFEPLGNFSEIVAQMLRPIGDPRSREGPGRKPPQFAGDVSRSTGIHGTDAEDGMDDGWIFR